MPICSKPFDRFFAEVAGVRRVRDRRGVPSAPLGRSIPAASRFSSAARAIGTACCLSLAARVTSADTMIWSAPSTTA